MFHCTDMTVLERQRARLKWQSQHQHSLLLQQQQQQHDTNYFSHDHMSTAATPLFPNTSAGLGGTGLLSEAVMKPDPGLIDKDYGFVGVSGNCTFENIGNVSGSCLDVNYYSHVSSVPAAATGFGAGDPVVSDKIATSSGVGTDNSRKRKADKVITRENSMDKKNKSSLEDGDSKITQKSNNNKRCSSNNKNSNTNKENSGETSKDNSKVTEVQKPDYIHVRARRGQATDSHSLAERVRREKISERMKYLQNLVPGCNKITGKAGMLDEIINYVQSLQRQVEFLSMKLASGNPRIDIDIDNLIAKEVLPASSTNILTREMSADLANHLLFPFNPMQQQLVNYDELHIGVNPPDMGLRRTMSTPDSMPQMFLDSSCFTQLQPPSTWDIDLQNLYNQTLDQERSTSFPSQPLFTGSLGDCGPNMDMQI